MNIGQLFYVGRLTGATVYDPIGDPLGRVVDVVLHEFSAMQIQAVGLVIEVGKKRVFLPMTRIISIHPNQVITNGVLNLRRFKQRKMEILAIQDMLDLDVTLLQDNKRAVILDIALELQKRGEWEVRKLFIETYGSQKKGLFRKTQSAQMAVGIEEVKTLKKNNRPQGTKRLLEEWESLKPAEIAELIQGLSFVRQKEIVKELPENRLADILEEMPERNQVKIISLFDEEQAALILGSMEPDDAADLLNELPEETSSRLLAKMEPEEADDVMQLLSYAKNTAGGLMTTEIVILPPEASVSEALASVRKEELPVTVASAIFVARSPLETPTGRFIGTVHIQALLRVPPFTPVGDVVDKNPVVVHANDKDDYVIRMFATYDQMIIPVLSKESNILGAITIDDVLDHMLPDNWRTNGQ
jgi:flagellar motility protein MotE (MotC chaperone)